jgi:hypothetical protein
MTVSSYSLKSLQQVQPQAWLWTGVENAQEFRIRLTLEYAINHEPVIQQRFQIVGKEEGFFPSHQWLWPDSISRYFKLYSRSAHV